MRNIALLLLAPLGLALACSRTPALDTETFALNYLDALQAKQIVEPYIYADRPGAPGAVSWVSNTITVRETRDNLDKIRRVLAEFDRPKPTVRLHFQLIEANGYNRTDSAIAAVEVELRKLFRFTGYRLLSEVVVGGTEGSAIEQVVRDAGRPEREEMWIVTAQIGMVRAVGDSGAVEMQVGVRNPERGALQTSVSARVGKTIVVGNAQIGPSGRTVILTVRPEFVP